MEVVLMTLMLISSSSEGASTILRKNPLNCPTDVFQGEMQEYCGVLICLMFGSYRKDANIFIFECPLLNKNQNPEAKITETTVMAGKIAKVCCPINNEN
ncbi:hypothetical protein PIB30_081372 [Stylosanthes scabra]|uniref:Uncharacterized protein n=1 Tax=Stylosanthes scabra TaxID=79078 RepID=A0ABU6XU94_9FABA|nr:hypothetical protein [Stylosanthes scabra]